MTVQPEFKRHSGASAMAPRLVVRESGEAPADWNEWLESAGANAGSRQTSWRAAQFEIEYGGSSYFLEARQDGSRVAGMLATWVPLSGRFTSVKRMASVVGRLRYSRLEIFDGPAVPSGDLGYVEPLMDRLDMIAKRHRVAGIRFSCFPPGYDVSDDSQIHRLLVKHGYRRIDWNTSVLSLDLPEEQALAHLRAKERSAIRKCERSGVLFQECTDEESYLRYFVKGYYSRGADLASERRQWRANLPEYSRFFVALSADGQVLATLATYRFNGYVTVRRIKRTIAGKMSKLAVQDFLHWRVMHFHRSLGDRWFDLAGIAPEPSTEKEAGIRFFKTKWGGTEKSAPRYFKDMRSRLQRALPGLNRTGW
jgi:hypothetical protein